MACLYNPAFSVIDFAKDFLNKNLIITGDYANNWKIDISSPAAACDKTTFEVLVTDLLCENVTLIKTIPKKFMLHAGDKPLSVSVGFYHTSKNMLHSAKKILVVEESLRNFINAKFWYMVKVSAEILIDLSGSN